MHAILKREVKKGKAGKTGKTEGKVEGGGAEGGGGVEDWRGARPSPAWCYT